MTHNTAMIFVEWADEFRTGIAEIDSQHKNLVSMLIRLHISIRDHHGTATSRVVLNELAEYTRVHFATEESLMRISHYPGFYAHKKIHADLIQQVLALQMKVDSGSAKITFELLHFLKNWLMNHIAVSDKEFGNHFSNTLASERWAPPKGRRSRWKFW